MVNALIPVLLLVLGGSPAARAAEVEGTDYDKSQYISGPLGPSRSYIFDAQGNPVPWSKDDAKDKKKAKKKKAKKRQKISKKPGKWRPKDSRRKSSRTKKKPSSRRKAPAPEPEAESEEDESREGFSDGAVRVGEDPRPSVPDEPESD